MKLTESTIGGTWHESAMKRLAADGREFGYTREDYLAALAAVQGEQAQQPKRPETPEQRALRLARQNVVGETARITFERQGGADSARSGREAQDRYRAELERLGDAAGLKYGRRSS